MISVLASKKSRGRRFRASIPRLPELNELLERLSTRDRKPDVTTVLVNSFGRPWSGDGFTGSFNRIRDAAGIAGIDEQGRERKKHLHDVRGTFCTKLVRAGCTDQEIAEIMGWSPQQVAGIRSTYVDRAAVVVAIASRLRGRV
jgi:integrase